jgi:hypothetical protein
MRKPDEGSAITIAFEISLLNDPQNTILKIPKPVPGEQLRSRKSLSRTLLL